jgi:hypothetical protein
MSDVVRPTDFRGNSRPHVLADAIRIPSVSDPSWPHAARALQRPFIDDHSGSKVQIPPPPLGGWPKRAVDIAIALVALPMLSPLILISMILI